MAPEVLPVELDDDLLGELDLVAQERGVTRAEAVLLACREFTRQMRDYRAMRATPADAPKARYRSQDAKMMEAAWIGDFPDDWLAMEE